MSLLDFDDRCTGGSGAFQTEKTSKQNLDGSACLSKSEAAVPGGRRRSQTEKTSKQTMNDLLACLWEMCHNNAMSITNLPPMGNAERGITLSLQHGDVLRYVPFFFDSVPDAGAAGAPSQIEKTSKRPELLKRF